MKSGIWIGLPAVLFTLWIGKLYLDDSKTVEQAILVQDFLRDHCEMHGAYPQSAELETRFPELFPGQEWYYWPNEDYSSAAFQYPMSLPFMGPPGTSKLSEFLPVIYAYAARHPCEDLI